MQTCNISEQHLSEHGSGSLHPHWLKEEGWSHRREDLCLLLVGGQQNQSSVAQESASHWNPEKDRQRGQGQGVQQDRRDQEDKARS